MVIHITPVPTWLHHCHTLIFPLFDAIRSFFFIQSFDHHHQFIWKEGFKARSIQSNRKAVQNNSHFNPSLSPFRTHFRPFVYSLQSTSVSLVTSF